MDKFYIKNGEEKLTVVCETQEDAALVMGRHLLKKKVGAAILITVTQRGFIDDLVAANMEKELDDGAMFLTSEMFEAVAQEYEELDEDKFCEYMEACTFMIDRETEQIEQDTKIGGVISELTR